MRIAQELAREQDDVGLALRQHVVCLSRRRDHAHRSHDDVRVSLLDSLRERDLQKQNEGDKKKRDDGNARVPASTRVSSASSCAPLFLRKVEEEDSWRRAAYLVPRLDGNLLRGPVAPRADVDQVDAELLQLARQPNRLLDAPLQPFPVRVIFGALCPIGSAEPHEQRPVSPRGADGLDDAEQEACAVLEGLSAVRIRASVGERR